MKRFSSFLCGFLCCLLIAGLCVSAFADGDDPNATPDPVEPTSNESPSGSVYSGPMSYTSSVVSSYDYWKASSNSLAGIWYKLGSTTQSGSVIYLLNQIYNKIPSSSGGSTSSWTSTQASNIVSYTYDIKTALGYSSTSTLSSKLNSIDTHIQAISSPTVNTGWTSTQASSVVSNTQSIVSKLTNIDGSTDGLESKLDLIYSGTILNYFPDFATYLANLDGVGPKIDTMNSNVQLNTQTVSDFYTYFSESASPVTFRYHYRSSPGATLSRSSTTSEVAYLTATAGNRKAVETYSGSDMSFFDRLTLLNNNVVTLGTEFLTPNTAYTLRLTDYNANSYDDYSFVSIGDFLHFIGRTVDPLRRLAFMTADDDDIAMKRDTQDQRDYIRDQYADGGSAPSADDMGVVNDSVGSILDSFSTGQSESFSTYYSYAQDQGYSFWSQPVLDQMIPVQTRGSSPSPFYFEGDYELIAPDIWSDFNG